MGKCDDKDDVGKHLNDLEYKKKLMKIIEWIF